MVTQCVVSGRARPAAAFSTFCQLGLSDAEGGHGWLPKHHVVAKLPCAFDYVFVVLSCSMKLPWIF